MVNKAISDSGPIIHLHEIDCLNALDLFEEIIIPPSVETELKRKGVPLKQIIVRQLTPGMKDKSKVFSVNYELDIGESEAIVLAIEEHAEYFLTDDLDARIIGAEQGLEVHGTIGIILRAFRDKLLNKANAIEKLGKLKTNSSLFITQDLVNLVIRAIQNYKS